MTAPNIVLRGTERACFFGKTGTGKTTLARSLLYQCARTVVLDPKHMFTPPPGVKIVSEYTKRLAHQVIRVEPDGWESERWRQAIYQVWQRGNTVLYVDECTLISPARTILPELGRVIRTGRERGLGVWIASQRPKDIPSVVFTESEHFFVFRLQWEEDRKKVASFTHDALQSMLPRLKGHDFAYVGIESDTVALVHNIIRGSK